ncbi:uncharacterized protein LOC117168481 [Belonocnema kinseyi]|uniref:uncharacterized protein LOC117168481 n=1 Tax=Belonocnema kinseyi TaxID=2817044 RepID=UPI00143CC431|nr:uncharacterized protein LOC117168481 [Belonocnema kinseyi]XP_033210064.1 uncharacterized protein LOC117168481 [Belonocnema kinseyi]
MRRHIFRFFTLLVLFDLIESQTESHANNNPNSDVTAADVSNSDGDVTLPNVTIPDGDVHEPVVAQPHGNIPEPDLTNTNGDVPEPDVTNPNRDVSAPDVTNPDGDGTAEDATTTETELLPEDETEFADNRIDEIPTYVPPAERLLKKLAGSLKNIAGQSDPEKNGTRVGKIISGITKPITGFLKPVGKTLSRGKDSSGFGDILNAVKDKFQAIYPGTLWCGAGNKAKSDEEIGFFKDTDVCCRDHDHCRSAITAGRSSEGLRNDGIFTRSHCDCDNEFHVCLKKANSSVSNKIGTTYFNILRPQCFKEDYPATCIKYGHLRISRSKCKEYKMDQSKNKTMQWFDNPDF